MKTGKPFFLIHCISICWHVSSIMAAIHYCLLAARMIKVPLYVSFDQESVFKNLLNIWYNRLVRRVISVSVRSPLRASTLRLVNTDFPLVSDSGCVMAVCHTPWKRLLVQWCLENNFALIIANGKWRHQKGRLQKQGEGFSDLRDTVNHLRKKGRIVVAFDCFSNGPAQCPLKFLGKYCKVSMLPARLAKIASVPLITAIPRLRDGMINIDWGPRFSLNKLNDPTEVMQTLISFLESEIKNNPGIWPAKYYRFAANSATLN